MRSLVAATLFLAAGLIGSTEARAAEHKWGIGPRIGTFVIPGRYPISFPTRIANYNFIQDGPQAGDPEGDQPNRDLDENGEPLESSLARVRDDLQIAVDGFWSINRNNRIGGGVGAGFGLGEGRGMLDYWVTFNYDRVLVHEPKFNLVGGGQLGFGQLRFQGSDEDELLRLGYYPLRARIQAQILDKTRLYGFGAFVQTSVPSNTRYRDLEGVEQERVGSPLNFALFLTAGIDLQIMFGDFRNRPDRLRKKKGKRRNRGRRNNNRGGQNNRRRGGPR